MRHFLILSILFAVLLETGCRDTATRVPNTVDKQPPQITPQAHHSKEKNLGTVVNAIEGERVIWQKPEIIIQKLGDIRDKTIADIGASTGFFAFRLVPRAKKVVAVEIDPKCIHFMDSIKKNQFPDEFKNRFEARLAVADDPKLKAAEIDNVVMINIYTYLPNRIEYLRTVRHGIIKGGKILIIDFKKKNIAVAPPMSERLEINEVERELRIAGYKNIVVDDTSLDYQYIVMATRL
jgi:SAM-dependent methyltransferase